MGDQQVRMKDIAARAGVSTVTVSKALAGYSGVSESVRAKIVALAKEMGYEPVTERRKRKRACFNIGLLVPSAFLSKTEPFYSLVLQDVTEECSRLQCNLTTEIIGAQMEKECSVPMVIREENMDGLILLGSFSGPYLEMLSRRGRIPMVFLGFLPDNTMYDCVISDVFYAACQVTNYLLNRGHTKIGFVGRILETPLNMEQYLGYVRAMTEHGIPVREKWVITGKALERMEEPDLQPEDSPTAFVCGSDASACCLYGKLKLKGLRCPADVSIVKFGNAGYHSEEGEEFTFYELDGKEMARKAVQALIRRMNGEYSKKQISIVAGHLREKKSVQLRK